MHALRLPSPSVVATAGLSELDLVCIVIAIACGATVLSHVDDPGPRLVGHVLGMDEKTTLKTWTVMAALRVVIGFVPALTLSLAV